MRYVDMLDTSDFRIFDYLCILQYLDRVDTLGINLHILPNIPKANQY